MISCTPPASPNIYGSGFGVSDIVVENTSGKDLTKWQAIVTFEATVGQIFNKPNEDETGLSTAKKGNSIIVKGKNLAADATVTFGLGGNFSSGNTTEAPTCIAEELIPAPVVPLEPDATGPIANGWCAANSGLGTGSTAYNNGYAYAVLQSGRAIQIGDGKAQYLELDGEEVTDAIFISNGDYTSTACLTRVNGDVHCGNGTSIKGDIGFDDGSQLVNIGGTSFFGFCTIAGDGRVFCGKPGQSGDYKDFGTTNPVTNLNCGRDTDCCVIDSEGDIFCENLGTAALQLPANGAKPVQLTSTDQAYCAIFDDKKAYCWEGGQLDGSLGGSIVPSLVAYPKDPIDFKNDLVLGMASSFAVSCWAHENGEVSCSGTNPGSKAGGGKTQANKIRRYVAGMDASSYPLLDNIVAVNTSRAGACAAAKNGDLYCWGKAGGQDEYAYKIDLGTDAVRLPLDCR